MEARQFGKLLARRFQKVVAGRGPFPVDRFDAQASLDGILVNVIQRRQNCAPGGQVAIVTRTFLPKPKASFPGSFSNRELFDQRRSLRKQDLFDLLGKRLFDEAQIPAEIRLRSRGQRQQMNVLRHEHESQQLKALRCSSGIQRPRQFFEPADVGESLFSPITGKREFMQVPRFMKMLNGLPMGHVNRSPTVTVFPCHTQRHWQSQWHPKPYPVMQVAHNTNGLAIATRPLSATPASLVCHRLCHCFY